MGCGCSGSDSNAMPLNTDAPGGYEVRLPDGSTERYGSFIPANRRAQETGGTVHDIN